MDRQRFLNIINNEVSAAKDSIGLYKEKSMHAALKRYCEDDEKKHEIKFGPFVADIINNEGITEIQTDNFNKLQRKLEVFLERSVVTIVYPVAAKKTICWLDETTKEVIKRRVSPRKGTHYDILPQLYRIKCYIKNANLRLRIILVEAEEYRILDGWSADKKKGASRQDRLPVDIIAEVFINSLEDYHIFVPDLPEPFSSKDYMKATGLSLKKAQTALNVLYYCGAVERSDKSGNLILYRTMRK